ncbi:MAG TPA: dTDP-glucose 4,6-dehydratase [Paenibacillus sp.]|nr:dTDP-glucose 4,6-dehydratase [Paenibacillus sp.]
MRILNNPIYTQDIKYVANLSLPWERLRNKKILISGASGMIGSFFIDVIMYRNEYFYENCLVIAVGRDEMKAQERFCSYWKSDCFTFLQQDINAPLSDMGDIDFVIHAASNTHPVAYASDPIGTVTTNIIGTYNLLNYASEHNAERFLFASSVEIYGENRGDIEKFDESYCGFIDCNTLRAGYPESKRAGEAICQAFIKQKGLNIVITRLSRIYGPTIQMSDTKAISQFIKKALSRENIILKSGGTQLYSYNYIADAVSGMLTVLLKGECGEAYNISDDESNITLKDLAGTIAKYVETEVVFETPDKIEESGYSKATKALLDSRKLQNLGWKAKYSIQHGLIRTIDILSEVDSTEFLKGH